MNRTTRLYSRPALAIAALTVLASGCIVVVEKEDDRHDRHRHLYTKWTVDIIVYRTETVSAPAPDVTVIFQETGRLLAATDCGEITGSFEVNDNDALSVSGLEMRDDCARGDRTLDLFRRAMAEARSYDADERELRISSSGDGMIGLSAR